MISYLGKQKPGHQNFIPEAANDLYGLLGLASSPNVKDPAFGTYYTVKILIVNLSQLYLHCENSYYLPTEALGAINEVLHASNSL